MGLLGQIAANGLAGAAASASESIETMQTLTAQEKLLRAEQMFREHLAELQHGYDQQDFQTQRDAKYADEAVGVDAQGLPLTRRDIEAGKQAMSKDQYERNLGLTPEQKAEHDARMGLLGIQTKGAEAALLAKEDRRGSVGKDYDDLERVFGADSARKMIGSKYGKKDISEYQRVQALDKVQEIIDKSPDDGVTDKNVAQVNAMLRSIGEPVYERVMVTPEKKGFLGGVTPATYKWVPGTKVESEDGASNQPAYDPERVRKAIGAVESGNRSFNADGSPVTSSKGAMYEKQVMPATAGDPGFNVKPAKLTGDPKKDAAEYNRVGDDYIISLIDRYGSVPAGVAAYNMGPGAFEAWQKNGAKIEDLPEETRNHVVKFMKAYNGEGGGLIAGRGKAGDVSDKKTSPPVDLSVFDVARPKSGSGTVSRPSGAYQAQQEQSPSPVSIAPDLSSQEQSTGERTPPMEQVGLLAGNAVDAVKKAGGAARDVKNSIVAGLDDKFTRARDFGESFGTTERYAQIFKGLTGAAKSSWEAMKENGVTQEQVAQAAMEQDLSIEKYLEQFARGYTNARSKS